MKLRRLYTLLLGMAAVIAHASTMTIDECVAKAQEHYPEIAQYGLIEASANFNLANASKAWLPQVGVYGQGTWQNDVMTFPEALTNVLAMQGVQYPGFEKLQYKAGVNVEQTVWDGGATNANKEQIRTAADIQKKAVALDLYDLATRVEDIYFSILIIDRRIEQMKTTKNLLDSVMHTVDVRIANGVAMLSDRYETEAKIVETDRQIDRMTIMKDTYMAVLALFVGENIDGKALLVPAVAETPFATKPTEDIFLAKLANLTAKEKAVAVSLRPKIGAFAGAWYGYPGFNSFKAMTSSTPNFNFLIGLKVNWNIGEFYTGKNRRNLISTQRKAVETEHATLEYNRNIQAAQIDGELAALQNSLLTDNKMVELRRQIRMSAQTQYANGVTDATTLLSKVTDEESARIALTIDELMVVQTKYKLNRTNNR